VSIDDRAGGVADRLETLAGAGASFEMVFARRTPESPGKGMLFATPVRGAKVTRAAREAGMGIPPTIHSVRIEGTDRPGLGAKITRALADAGISFRGISAIAIGRNFVSYLACDSAEDQARAIAALKKLK
jgi:predicted amino acid-binding ACT domain protein